MSTVNTSSVITLTDIHQKLNPHIDAMNAKGWELMSVAQQEVGIQEVLILFWKKTVVPDTGGR
jgi:hypothetical protein